MDAAHSGHGLRGAASPEPPAAPAADWPARPTGGAAGGATERTRSPQPGGVRSISPIGCRFFSAYRQSRAGGHHERLALFPSNLDARIVAHVAHTEDVLRCL